MIPYKLKLILFIWYCLSLILDIRVSGNLREGNFFIYNFSLIFFQRLFKFFHGVGSILLIFLEDKPCSAKLYGQFLSSFVDDSILFKNHFDKLLPFLHSL